MELLQKAAYRRLRIERVLRVAAEDQLGKRQRESTLSQNLPLLQTLLQANQAVALNRHRTASHLRRPALRERRIVRLRCGLEGGRHHSLAEVGALYGLTRERIRQIEAAALAKLRK